MKRFQINILFNALMHLSTIYIDINRMINVLREKYSKALIAKFSTVRNGLQG